VDAQIITGEAHRMMRVNDCVNRSSILWFAARRKGIARSAALHLDCACSPQRGRVWIHAGEARRRNRKKPRGNQSP